MLQNTHILTNYINYLFWNKCCNLWESVVVKLEKKCTNYEKQNRIKQHKMRRDLWFLC